MVLFSPFRKRLFRIVPAVIFLMISCLVPLLSFSEELDEDEVGAVSSREIIRPLPPEPEPKEEKVPTLDTGKAARIPFRITSEEFLDYDEESNFIYGRARTKVWYRDIYLEADRLIYDVRLNEVQAYGNIVLETEGDEYKADSLWYSMDKGRGVAYGASGRRRNIFIHSDPEEKDLPTFELMSQTADQKPREALFRKSSYSSCDFPVPHYRIRCKEILFYPDDRVFFRGATFYIWEVPVFYLPFYTRTLDERFPWSVIVGYDSKLGAFLRIGYDYHHAEYEPALDDEGDWIKKSRGHLSAHLDFSSKRGIGYGAIYKYFFDYGKHRGIFDLYRIADKQHDVKEYSHTGETRDEEDYARWIARIQHRSQITDDIYLQLDIDEMSDPDIYYDLLDRFREKDRYRVPERNIRAALTLRRDAYIGRLLFQIRHRIGRDRITNYAYPGDNDPDYDLNPYRDEDVDDEEGYPRDRYGRVSERMPQLTFSTNYLKLGGSNFFTYTDLNIINNLDKGLNTVDDGDDAWVRGMDLYQALLYRWRLARNYTLTARLGVGASFFQRENYDFSYDFPPGTVFPYDLPYHRGGLTFLDEDTFIVGRRHYDDNGNLITTMEELEDWRKASLDDVKKYYLYSDLMLYFYARFTDYFHGWIRYDLREGTDDSLGEFYESLGDVSFRQDLYNFRLPEHWIRAGLRLFFRYPNLSTYLSGGYNLQGGDDIYANEELYFAAIGMNYVNNAETFTFDTSVRYSGRQEYDPSDPWEDQVDYIYGVMNAQYMPLSRMWWTSLNIAGHKNLGNDHDDDDNDDSFDEYDTEFNVLGILGGKVGPKYTVEGQVQYKNRVEGSGISDIRAIIKRDLHDFIASVMIGLKRDLTEQDDDDDDDKKGGELQLDTQFTLEFKSPYRNAPIGAATIKTLADRMKEAEVAGDEEFPTLFVDR